MRLAIASHFCFSQTTHTENSVCIESICIYTAGLVPSDILCEHVLVAAILYNTVPWLWRQTEQRLSNSSHHEKHMQRLQ